MAFLDLPDVGCRLWVRTFHPTPNTPSQQPTQHCLLLHGWPDTGDLWASQAPALAQAGYTVLVPDMPGFGRSSFTGNDPPLSRYSLRSIVGVLTALLDELGIDRLALLCGHDWGAATAWAFAAQAPSRLSRLAVLSVGHPDAGAAVDPRQRAHWWYQLFFCLPGAEAAARANGWALFRQIMGSSCSEVQLQAYVQQLEQPGALASSLAWYRANTHPRHFAATQPLPADASRLLRIPVLGVWSSDDSALLEPQMLASSRYVAPGCWRYERLQGVGHWIPRDAPEQLNRLLLEFAGQAAATVCKL